PQRLAGPTTARRGACCHAGCRCVVATHKVTAVRASSLGITTNRLIWARRSVSTCAPSGRAPVAGRDGVGEWGSVILVSAPLLAGPYGTAIPATRVDR
ncbi:hypothetical protein DEH69_10315, partial [Streptomyces sp. PT12]